MKDVTVKWAGYQYSHFILIFTYSFHERKRITVYMMFACIEGFYPSNENIC